MQILQIGRHLKGTANKGLILQQSMDGDELEMNVCVDAAFACVVGARNTVQTRTQSSQELDLILK